MNMISALTNLLEEDDEREGDPVPSFSLNHPGIVHLPTAQIATKLEPLTHDYVRHGSRASVIGYDGAYVAASKDTWRKTLSEWLHKGCDVRYLLQDLKPGSSTFRSLTALAEDTKNAPGKFSVFVKKDSKLVSASAAKYLKEWETFHFVSFQNPAHLWIEACHLPGEVEAHDCYYLPPEVALESALPEIYQRRFDEVVHSACDQIL